MGHGARGHRAVAARFSRTWFYLIVEVVLFEGISFSADSLLLCKGFIMSQISTGGISMYLRRETMTASIRKQHTRYLKESHGFDKELPKTVEQAYAPDAKNGITLWADAMSKEMENVRVAFEFSPDGKHMPRGYQIVQ